MTRAACNLPAMSAREAVLGLYPGPVLAQPRPRSPHLYLHPGLNLPLRASPRPPADLPPPHNPPAAAAVTFAAAALALAAPTLALASTAVAAAAFVFAASTTAFASPPSPQQL